MFKRRQLSASTTEPAGLTYMDLLVQGKVQPEEIDDFIDRWHEASEGSGAAEQALNDYLGMTWQEYRLWVERPEALQFIVSAHKAGRSLVAELQELGTLKIGISPSARDQARRLLDWLENTERPGQHCRC